MQSGLPKGAAGKELQAALLPGEEVIGWGEGKGGSFLIATSQRAMIVKAGIATGQFFGRKVFAVSYNQLTSVDLQTGMFDGYAQLVTPGSQARAVSDRVAQMHNENSCAFNKGEEQAFREVVGEMRQRLHESQNPTSARPIVPAAASPAATTGAPSIPDQIAALAKLHDAGVLTDEEFTAKKAELLARM
ncbi:MAG TPA: SHOCT domain-containing protein [Ktedonobacterales bacterium]